MQSKTTPLLFLGSLAALTLVGFDLYQPALPQVIDYFNTTYAVGQLSFSLYLLSFGLSQLFWGPIVDHFGRRRVLPISLLLFFMATITCMTATTIKLFILGRVVQGFSACCAGIVSISATRDCEDSTERARLLSYISMIVSTSPLFAPMIGSIILMYFTWQVNFALMAIYSSLLLVIGYFVLSESPHWQYNSQYSGIKAAFSSYHDMLRHKQFRIGIILNASIFTMLMILVINAAYLLIIKLHISPFQFALLFGINGIFMIGGQLIGIRLRNKHSLIWNIKFGSILLMSGALLLLLLYGFLGLTLLTLSPALIIGVGTCVLSPTVISICLTSYPQNAATAISVINTVRMTISATLAGIIGSLISYSMWFLPASLLVCSLICFFAAYFFVKDTN